MAADEEQDRRDRTLLRGAAALWVLSVLATFTSIVTETVTAGDAPEHWGPTTAQVVGFEPEGAGRDAVRVAVDLDTDCVCPITVDVATPYSDGLAIGTRLDGAAAPGTATSGGDVRLVGQRIVPQPFRFLSGLGIAGALLIPPVTLVVAAVARRRRRRKAGLSAPLPEGVEDRSDTLTDAPYGTVVAVEGATFQLRLTLPGSSGVDDMVVTAAEDQPLPSAGDTVAVLAAPTVAESTVVVLHGDDHQCGAVINSSNHYATWNHRRKVAFPTHSTNPTAAIGGAIVTLLVAAMPFALVLGTADPDFDSATRMTEAMVVAADREPAFKDVYDWTVTVVYDHPDQPRSQAEFVVRNSYSDYTRPGRAIDIRYDPQDPHVVTAADAPTSTEASDQGFTVAASLVLLVGVGSGLFVLRRHRAARRVVPWRRAEVAAVEEARRRARLRSDQQPPHRLPDRPTD